MRNPEPARCPICDVRLSRVPADHVLTCENPRAAIEACAYCQQNKGQMHPPHFASANCQSGRHNHCSCDLCF